MATHHDLRRDPDPSPNRRNRRGPALLALLGVLALLAIVATWYWWTDEVTLAPGAAAPMAPASPPLQTGIVEQPVSGPPPTRPVVTPADTVVPTPTETPAR